VIGFTPELEVPLWNLWRKWLKKKKKKKYFTRFVDRRLVSVFLKFRLTSGYSHRLVFSCR
jgi:hypothetical protein